MTNESSRTILHVDMDAFYASVEQRDHPEMRGKPVVVGGSWGRGVVTAASYEAREYGIHSAMPGRRAAELCPHAIFVRGRIDHYAAVGRQVREIMQRYTPVIQPLSLDEAFLDVTGTLRLHGDARTIGKGIQEAIRRELDLPASVGIAPLKFIAKIASDIQKPNGFVEVQPGRVQEFLDPLPISRLWGVGKVANSKLQRRGFHRVSDIRNADLKSFRRQYGRWGEHLWNLANAIDPRAVVVDHVAKSIGHERTFAEDLDDDTVMLAVLSYLCEQSTRRLRHCNRLARCVSLKYRLSDFSTHTKTSTFSEATDRTEAVLQTITELLVQMRKKFPSRVRLLGVSLSSLSEVGAPRQLSLFDHQSEKAQQQVDQVSDQLHERLGTRALYRGSSHQWVVHKSKTSPDEGSGHSNPT